ncbi:hypothetical protein PFISCL1PPCAC_15900 [Pristionchus fissidentatus]|uniref:Glutamyl-tRNA(Gln) amidotransferase subunit A, mitochondrial n=1 Tax=Pristionchus fissidentatus TaxID=1538716 RepID=A0AAV5VYX5_9BILA|nr:hypothetical protein PFISCL1PPCAC_15900 [Pristionchus fissidentatus]
MTYYISYPGRMHKIEQAIAFAIRSRPHNALITETFELARSQARAALEKGLQPFPVVVKDCFAVDSVPMTCASRMLESFTPPYTATVVRKLIDNGACVIGKANLDEFCMGTSSALGYFGPVKSGLSDESKIEEDWLIPGGSSGGPAVAVQMGFAEMGLGSDTGGSTRNPAAFNGLVGFKPTYGICSRFGLVPLVNSMDAPSIFARTPKECARYLEMMVGVDDLDATSLDLPKNRRRIESLKGLRIGIPKEMHNDSLSQDAWAVWNAAAAALQQAGAVLETVSLPYINYSLICYHVLAAVDVASNMARFDGISFGYRSKSDEESTSSTYGLLAASRSDSLNEVVRRRIFAGNYYLMKENREKYYEQALKVRRLISDGMRKALEKTDILLTPVACGAPPLYSDLSKGGFQREDADDFYTQPVNLAGNPAISLPFGCTSDKKLPIGVQLIGSHFDDLLLTDVGRLLMEQKRYMKKRGIVD